MTKGNETKQPQPKTPPQRWRGDAVEDQPGTEAERRADRAEGNTPVSPNVEREKMQEPPDPDQQPERVHGPAKHASDAEAEIAEEHRERRESGERPPRGKL